MAGGPSDRSGEPRPGTQTRVDPEALKASIDSYVESAQRMERWVRNLTFAVLALMLAVLALALLLPAGLGVTEFTKAMALAIWLVGGCLVAASFPDAAGIATRRRRAAMVGFLTLLAIGALPITLTRGGAAMFVIDLLTVLGLSAFYVYMVGELGAVFDRLSFGSTTDLPDEFDDPEALREKLTSTSERLRVMESGLRWTLLPAGRRRLRAHAEAVRRLREDPSGEVPAELDFGRLRRRLVGGYEVLAGYAIYLAAAIKIANLLSEFRRSEPAIVKLRGRVTRFRTVGPALLAFGFILAWLCVYLVVWIIEPTAWRGVGQHTVRFGDFVYLAVSGAFGGGDSPVKPATQAMRMLLLAETITAATILTLYIRAVWEEEKAPNPTAAPRRPEAPPQ